MAVNEQQRSQIKSKERVSERGEVFTAEREVNAMLDLVANECLRPDSRFLEPACGDGNFLSAILKRKLTELRRKYKKSPRDYEKQAIVAIGSLYGVDIMNDNVLACRERLFVIWDETTPIILAKSCHDLDILRWFVGKPCQSIVADGSLTWFKPENAPQGAPKRCTDGCPHESTCPYSAIDIYVKRKQHLGVFDLKNSRDEQEITSKISDPNNEWGRCVYFCDNNQPDHFVCEMVFADGTTASFSMEAFTPFGGRRTRIMGTTGYIEGDGSKFTVYEFRSNRKLVWDKKVSDIPEYKGSGHGGGDMALVCDFIEAVSAQDESKLTSSIDASIESHVMGFRAEKSRLSNKKSKMPVSK